MNSTTFHFEERELEALMERGQLALARAGLSAQDLLDELPAARDEVVTETYGAEFLAEMEGLRRQLCGDTGVIEVPDEMS